MSQAHLKNRLQKPVFDFFGATTFFGTAAMLFSALTLLLLSSVANADKLTVVGDILVGSDSASVFVAETGSHIRLQQITVETDIKGSRVILGGGNGNRGYNNRDQASGIGAQLQQLRVYWHGNTLVLVRQSHLASHDILLPNGRMLKVFEEISITLPYHRFSMGWDVRALERELERLGVKVKPKPGSAKPLPAPQAPGQISG